MNEYSKFYLGGFILLISLAYSSSIFIYVYMCVYVCMYNFEESEEICRGKKFGVSDIY